MNNSGHMHVLGKFNLRVVTSWVVNSVVCGCTAVSSAAVWKKSIPYNNDSWDPHKADRVMVKPMLTHWNVLIWIQSIDQSTHQSSNQSTNPVRPGPWFNIKMSSYQYRKSYCGDKTIIRPSYLHNGISHTGKMAPLYWIRALVTHIGVRELVSIGSGNGLTPVRCQGIRGTYDWSLQITFSRKFSFKNAFESHFSLLQCVS